MKPNIFAAAAVLCGAAVTPNIAHAQSGYQYSYGYGGYAGASQYYAPYGSYGYTRNAPATRDYGYQDYRYQRYGYGRNDGYAARDDCPPEDYRPYTAAPRQRYGYSDNYQRRRSYKDAYKY